MNALGPEDAWALLAARLAPGAPERLPRRSALGRVLALPVAARVDVPADDVSAMDGYAVGDSAQAGEALDVPGTIAAGHAPGARLGPGATALRIMTGAPLPAGADRVIPLERSDRGLSTVRLETVLTPGANVRRRGEVVRVGDPMLAAGSELTASALALLAAHGVGEVSVHRAPRVAVLTTGDEVVAPERVPGPGQLRDSHTDFLLAAGRRLGVEFVSLGIAPDEPAAVEDRLRLALGHDVAIVCGGVSAGEFDLVEGGLARLGCRILFERIAVQPGQPMVAAVHEASGALVFGLPGNPASGVVCFRLFVQPALRVLLGHSDHFWAGALAARLAADLPGAQGRDRFLPATLALASGSPVATPLAQRGSHDLLAYGRADALVRVPAHSPSRSAGERCEILPL
jgi:molybdopterin molybdotransferase